MPEYLASYAPRYRPGAVTVQRPSVSFGVPSEVMVELIDSEVKLASARGAQYDVFADQKYVGYVMAITDTTHRPGQRPAESHGWIGSDNLGGTLLSNSAEAAYRCVASVEARASV